MSVKKLADDIQSVICSSCNLTNYNRAVEELVYNSLDAKSTSIAIRIHIQESKIQVVDNGCGITKKDFKLLGQRYATSKCVNLSNFKSVPNTYGFRGQALSSMVDVSKHLKITSKTENFEKTWCKSFYAGKEQDFLEVPTRPSKGTTIEISGFLYNSKIKKKTVNNLQELNDIKTFLEQLSLVHSNISITLRDDSTNEIVFKMHKNRDIYQKIKILFDIEKTNIQELQIEKNEYKSHAYIGKKCDEITGHHWIFLNKKIVKNSKLNKLVQKYFNKHLKLACKIKKVKPKLSGDSPAVNKFIPFYVIFLSCPYYDYDVSSTPKHSVLEFKDWKPITTLLEKLIKFYFGDVQVKETKVQEIPKILPETDIREKVREITRKFLGSNSKKLGISQMQNGIKGKLIKRKKKKQKDALHTKLPLRESIDNLKKNKIDITSPKIDEIVIAFNTLSNQTKNTNVNTKRPCTERDTEQVSRNNKTDSNSLNVGNHYKNKSSRVVKLKPRKTSNKLNEAVKPKKTIKRKRDPLIRIFENQPEDVKKRCEILAKEAESTLLKHQSKQTVFINESVNYSNFFKDNKNISIRKRIGEIIIHDIIPLKNKINNVKHYTDHKNPFKTSHNLLKTILSSQQVESYSPAVSYRLNKYSKELLSPKNPPEIPQLTYQSHNYNRNQDTVMGPLNNSIIQASQFDVRKPLSPEPFHIKDRNVRFISKQSRDNFAMLKSANIFLKLHKKKMDAYRKKCSDFRNILNDDVIISNTLSYTNRVSINTCENNKLKDIENMDLDNMMINTGHNDRETWLNDNIIQQDEIRNSHKLPNFGLTYTITSSNMVMNMDNISFKNYECETDFSGDSFNRNASYHLSSYKDENSLNESRKNIVFVSKSQSSMDAITCSGELVPIDVCEPIINNDDCNHQDELQLVSNTNEHNVTLNNYSPSVNYQLQSLLVPNGNNHGDDNINLPSRQLPSHDIPTDYNVDKQHNVEINTKAINYENIEDNEIGDHDIFTESNYFNEENIENVFNCLNNNMFNLRNRHRFLPKGMSPIFENCNTKSVCNYNLDKEYFKGTLYNNFNNDVQANIEVYEATVRNAKDHTTKDIEKISSRLEKDHSNLTFSTKSIQGAKVLGQVDNKFITTILVGNLDFTNYLVLFDQHAVHERIRLEKNLSDYFDGSKWMSVNLDDVSLKMTKEEIMYLHNYRDKFNQFGLRWTIVDENEIKVQSIPLAILGKNPREVDKVMKTVNILITEEISNIISQKGCVSVYPKSIMELVNNEACRYAIMFGDSLSKKDCIELLENLSTCKTPFQCAHGRPVMAVVTEFKPKSHHYRVNLEKVLQFKAKCRNK